MIPILYESDEELFTSNGLGRLRDCISCVVTEERNGVYEVDFEYPVDGQNFDLITPGRIIACEHDDSDDIQPFDIVSYTKPLDGVVTFHGVHISYRMNGLTVYGKNINSLSDAFDLLATSTPANPFIYEPKFTSTAYFGAADGVPKSVREMLGGVEGSILDSYGGEYEFDRWTVRLWRQRGETRDFIIRYGVNMLDYNDETDYSETFNAAIPYWVGDNGKGVEVCVVGNHADSGLDTYGNREICVPLDLSEKFESKPTKTQLKNEALSYISSNDTNMPEQNITVDFVRLQDYTDYEQFALLLGCKLCDSIRVIFPKYGVDRFYKIVKTTYNVLQERYDEMELGNLSTSLSDALGISSGGSFSGGDVLAELTKTTVVNATGSINGGTYSSEATKAITMQSGYEAVGIVGMEVKGTNATYINVMEHYIDGTNIKWRGRNTSSSSNWSGSIDFYILWVKAAS